MCPLCKKRMRSISHTPCHLKILWKLRLHWSSRDLVISLLWFVLPYCISKDRDTIMFLAFSIMEFVSAMEALKSEYRLSCALDFALAFTWNKKLQHKHLSCAAGVVWTCGPLRRRLQLPLPLPLLLVFKLTSERRSLQKYPLPTKAHHPPQNYIIVPQNTKNIPFPIFTLGQRSRAKLKQLGRRNPQVLDLPGVVGLSDTP